MENIFVAEGDKFIKLKPEDRNLDVPIPSPFLYDAFLISENFKLQTGYTQIGTGFWHFRHRMSNLRFFIT